MSRLYTAELFDKEGNRVAVLENIHGIQWRRQFNRGNPINFAFPSSDTKKVEIDLSREFILYRGDRKVTRGKLTRRDFAGNPLYLSAMTPEIHLEALQTPPNWGAVWEGQELRTVLDDLLSEYKLLYVNTWEDYSQAVEAYQVDIDTEPGKIMLTTQAGTDGVTGLPTRTYHASGHIVFQFDCGEHDGFERVRWGQEIGDVVTIKVAYRTSKDGTTWGNWSGDLENRIDAGTLGIDLRNLLKGNLDRYIQIKVTLETEDVESPLYSWDDADLHGEQVYGFTPVFEGLELVYRREGVIAIGDTSPASFGIKARGIPADSEKHLGILTDIAEEYGLEFYVDTNLIMHVAQRPQGVNAFIEGIHLGTDRSSDVTFIDGRNTSIDVLEDDDTDLVNVLHCYGTGNGPGRLSLKEPLRDEVSIGLYGERPGSFIDTSITDRETLQERGQDYLRERAQPRQSFRVRTVWTDDMPELQVGDVVTVVVPHSELVTRARILDIDYTESDGEVLTIGLNTNLRDLLDRISDAEAKLREDPNAPVTTPGPPTQFRAVPQFGQITVSWIGSGDYFILEHSTNGSNWKVLESQLTTNRYVHTQLAVGSVHWYRIARVQDGVLSEFTTPRRAVVSTLPVDIIDTGDPPPTPSGIDVSSNTYHLKDGGTVLENIITWEAGSDDVKEYVIQRKEGDGEWIELISVPHPGTFWRDTNGLREGVEYSYRVKAVNNWGKGSEYTDPDSATTAPDITPPAVPAIMSVLPAHRLMIVSWSRNNESDFSHYVIEYNTSSDYNESTQSGTWGNWMEISPTSSNYFVHDGLSLSLAYRYRVRSVDRSNNHSEWSEPFIGGYPARISLSEDVIDRLKRGDLAEDIIAELDGIIEIAQKADDAKTYISAIARTAEELSQTVAEVYPDGLDKSSTIQQNAEKIALRVQSVQKVNIVTGRFRLIPPTDSFNLSSNRDDSNQPIDFNTLLDSIEGDIFVDSTVSREFERGFLWTLGNIEELEEDEEGEQLRDIYVDSIRRIIIGSKALYVSTNKGTSWSVRSSVEGDSLHAIDYTDSQDFHVVGEYRSLSEGVIITSANSSDWFRSYTGQDDILYDVNVHNPIGTTYLAVGMNRTNNHAVVLRRVGLNWTRDNFPNVTSFFGAASRGALTNELNVVVGTGGAIYRRSGSIWSKSTSNTEETLRGVAHGDATFVAVGDNGTIVSSGTGVTWTVRVSGVNSKLNAVAHGLDGFVAVGDAGVILLSPNGITWYHQEPVTNKNLHGVTYGDGQYVAVGEGGVIVTGTMQIETVISSHEVGRVVSYTAEQLVLDSPWTAVNRPSQTNPDRYTLYQYMPITGAQILVTQKDGRGRILLDAEEVIAPGTISAKELRSLGGGTSVTDKGLHIMEGALERLRIGQLVGLPWGSTTLSHNTPGVWGDEHNIFLRGYARILGMDYAFDEDIVDLSRIPNLSEPKILVAPKDMLTYWPAQPGSLPTIKTEVVDLAKGVFRVQAKTVIEEGYWTLPTAARSAYGTWQQPPPPGGVYTNRFQCRVAWHTMGTVFSHGIINIYQYVTNEYDNDGNPINWVLQRHSKVKGSDKTGVLNWDLNLDKTDYWTIRVEWAEQVASRAWIASAGYYTATYLNKEGVSIGPSEPSGMSVMYIAYDQG